MKYRRLIIIITGFLLLGSGVFYALKKYNVILPYKVGKQIDSFNGVKVYYNGRVSHTAGRNLTADKYNLGLNYQCVEFVKRYYYEHLNHKMPDSYGNAKDFFNKDLKDGQVNTKRALTQYSNPSISRPKVDDLLIFSGTKYNSFGHVAIVSNVTGNEVEIVQQNPGPTAKSRATFSIESQGEKWKINNERIMGWLRKE